MKGIQMAKTATNMTTGATIDRTELARALAKATAYAQCGKQHEAEQWARRLVELLGCADILRHTTTPAGWAFVGTDTPGGFDGGDGQG